MTHSDFPLVLIFYPIFRSHWSKSQWKLPEISYDSLKPILLLITSRFSVLLTAHIYTACKWERAGDVYKCVVSKSRGITHADCIRGDCRLSVSISHWVIIGCSLKTDYNVLLRGCFLRSSWSCESFTKLTRFRNLNNSDPGTFINPTTALHCSMTHEQTEDILFLDRSNLSCSNDKGFDQR